MTNEMDRLVAENVMGWKYNKGKITREVYGVLQEYHWNPSIDKAHAMQVVDKMIADGWIETALVYDGKGEWLVEFYKNDNSGESSVDKSLPLAICEAALKAVGAK